MTFDAPPDDGVYAVNDGYAAVISGRIVFWSKDMVDCEDFLLGRTMRNIDERRTTGT